MADAKRRLEANVDGEFFVDATCIDCGTCRWMAPETFAPAGGTARVHQQPSDAAERRRALEALISCPVGSIGTETKADLAPIVAGFPREVADGVFHMGFHSRDSFGATSYLIVREEGNVMVDSPRFVKALVKNVEALGGVETIFLTHRDDVADHARFAEHFGAKRILHREDVSSSTRDVELQPTGREAIRLADDLEIIPVPGHTAGSACLLLEDRVLFTGDHLAYDRRRRALRAFRGACWYDWETQTRSMERLLDYRFERILPGHGAPRAAPPYRILDELERCVEWMRRVT